MLAAPVTCSTVFDVERCKLLEVGKPLELKCEVADSAVPVCWYKDGVKLFPQNGWDMQSKGTMRRLIIPSAELLHSGLYSCETSDDTIHFTVDIKAPSWTLSPSPDVVEMQSLEESCTAEPTCEISDPAVQVSWQMAKEHGCNQEPDFDMGGIRKNLVIEHPSNSGAYYCATADDVAKLIVKNQVSPVTYLLGPEVETTKSTDVHCPIVQQFEISDPIAKACWYKDGTQIYPKRQPDSESQNGSQTSPLQPHGLSDDGRFGYNTSGDVDLNVNNKAEQYHYGDEIGEIADASAQYTVDVKALPPRLHSDQEKNKSTEEACPVEVDCLSSKCNSGISSSMGQKTQIYEEHSRHLPALQSPCESMMDWISIQQSKQLSDNQTENVQPTVYCNSVNNAILQCETHQHNKQAAESQGEKFIYYMPHAAARSEDSDNSQQTAVQLDGVCNFLQTATVELQEPILKNLTVHSQELCSSVQKATVHSQLSNSKQASTAQTEHQLQNTKFISEDSIRTPPVQLGLPFKLLQTEEFPSEKPFNYSQTAYIQSEEPLKPLQTTCAQSEELHSHMQSSDVLPEKLLYCIHTEMDHSKEPHNSLWTSRVQSEELKTLLQTLAIQSEKLRDFPDTATFQSVQFLNSQGETAQPGHHFDRLHNDYYTDQAVSDEPEALSTQETVQADWHHANEDQTDRKVYSGLRSSTEFTETHHVKQISTVQSEIYLSKTFDNHWADNVTANKVAVEGDLNG